MDATQTQNSTLSRGTLLAGGCLLIALAGLLRPAPAPLPTTSAPPIAEPAAENSAYSSGRAAGAEPRVTFAQTMPRAHGTQIFNNTGTPNPGLVMVAIPDGPKAVRFVPGSDPAAVRYLAETKAEQERLIVDRGPTDVDKSEIGDFGPLKGRATRRVRNLAADSK